MNSTPPITCAIYARVSTDHGLKQEFNSIDAQIESCQHYIAINKMHGWKNDPSHIFTDEALSGGNTERPALQKMLKLIRVKKIKVVHPDAYPRRSVFGGSGLKLACNLSIKSTASVATYATSSKCKSSSPNTAAPS